MTRYIFIILLPLTLVLGSNVSESTEQIKVQQRQLIKKLDKMTEQLKKLQAFCKKTKYVSKKCQLLKKAKKKINSKKVPPQKSS